MGAYVGRGVGVLVGRGVGVLVGFRVGEFVGALDGSIDKVGAMEGFELKLGAPL